MLLSNDPEGVNVITSLLPAKIAGQKCPVGGTLQANPMFKRKILHHYI